MSIMIKESIESKKAKKIIENILKNHEAVIFNKNKRREIRFIFRNREWTNEIETLFWINDPTNEEFIKSNISELIQNEFKKECIMPPIPAIMRKEYMAEQERSNKHETE